MKMNSLAIIVALTIGAGMTGCAAPTKYEWGGYDSSLYEYYKTPAEVERLAESLKLTIEKGEKTDKGGPGVPPGVYAEYGYIMMQLGKYPEAIILFEKEKKKWPESAAFMDKVIKLASTAQTKLAANITAAKKD